MLRPLAALFVSATVLAHGLAWPAVAAAPGSHACCVRVAALQQQCRTTVSCCPASERRQPGTVPPGSTNQGTSSPLLALTTLDAGVVSLVPSASAAALDAHALLRANAPPPLLYLKHLTLLV
jgi:hypothetical protein